MSLPLIAIPCAYDESGRRHGLPSFSLAVPYVDALSHAGGAPMGVPLGLNQAALWTLGDAMDGLLLTGGEDVSPSLYGVTTSTPARTIDEDRDRTECWLIRRALLRKLPILAICRGIQILNVVLGGTLYQDLATEVGDQIDHARFYPRSRLDELSHTVDVVERTRLAGIFGAGSISVNTRHHQAVRDLGEDLAMTAVAPDGVIEAIEMPDMPFVVGVQWHPENLLEQGAGSLELFRTFVVAAGSR